MSLLRFLAMTLATFVMAVPAIAVSAFDGGGPRSSAIVAAWARLVLALAGVRVIVEGRERLPPESAVVFVSTHQSMLDIPALFVAVPPRTRFVAKQELFRIPLFGRAIRMLGFVPLDRQDRRDAVRSLDLARRHAADKRPVLVFPEGTRSTDGSLLPFKKGAFALAHDLELPVVPLACLGGAACLPAHAMKVRPGLMTIRVGEVIEPGGAAHASRQTLMEEARRRIESLL